MRKGRPKPDGPPAAVPETQTFAHKMGCFTRLTFCLLRPGLAEGHRESKHGGCRMHLRNLLGAPFRAQFLSPRPPAFGVDRDSSLGERHSPALFARFKDSPGDRGQVADLSQLRVVPPVPGQVLRYHISWAGRTQAAFARAIGVSPARLNMILSGRCPISPEIALRLARVLGTPPEFWLRLRMEFELFHQERHLRDELDTRTGWNRRADILPQPKRPAAISRSTVPVPRAA
jgi:addiction module HigA family antidote